MKNHWRPLLLELKNKIGRPAMNPLTSKSLKQLISDVLEDALKDTEDIFADKLLAEPTEKNPYPPEAPLVETQNMNPTMSKVISVLNKLSEEDRALVFRQFGYFTSNHLLKQLSLMKQADKGTL